MGIAFLLTMNVLIVQHEEMEGPGLIGYYLDQENISYQTVQLKIGVCLPKIDHFTHVVFLGGPMNVYEEDRYPFLRDEDLFIKEAIQRGKSILGICLGAQLIAKALGAKVFKAPIKEIGWYDISLTKIGSKDPLLLGIPETFPVFQWHEDTFEIPRAARLIATSNPIAHQAFRYGERVYGLQFHPEMTEEMIQKWMETYEEDFKGSQPPLHLKEKILWDTERNMEPYKERGLIFLRNFFREIPTGGSR